MMWKICIGGMIASLSSMGLATGAMSQTTAIPAPDPVPESLQNLAENYNLLLLDDSGSFDENAPLLRRDYVTYTITAFDTLLDQINTRLAEDRQSRNNSCHIMETALTYLNRRVTELKQDIEQLVPTGRNSLISSDSPPKVATFPFADIEVQTPAENNYSLISNADQSTRYFYWLHELDPNQIDTMLPNAQQPLTHGDFVGYLSLNLDGFGTHANIIMDDSLQRHQEELQEMRTQLAQIFDLITQIREQIKSNQSANKGLKSDQMENPLYKPLITQVPAVNISPTEQIPDVSPHDPVYDALWKMIESYGVDVIQTDGYFHPDAVITMADFTTYQKALSKVIFEMFAVFPTLPPPTCGRFSTTFGEESAILQDQLRQLEAELQHLAM